ncbi:MAG: hypothetical protein IPI84_12895 [Holophagaceae bacterium]|nr:hypothetical protein [Holophagaceae bacterium]
MSAPASPRWRRSWPPAAAWRCARPLPRQRWPSGSRASPGAWWRPARPRASLPCLELRLPGLDEHPEAIPGLLAALAAEEGLEGDLPPSLGALPCPGNLRELRNRLLRWKLLGQSPASEPAGPPRFEAEDLATNLHALERYLLHQALRRAYGNRVEAARRLGVSRRQLYLLIRRHGDPVRGDEGLGDLPRRVQKRRPTQNSSPDPEIR